MPLPGLLGARVPAGGRPRCGETHRAGGGGAIAGRQCGGALLRSAIRAGDARGVTRAKCHLVAEIDVRLDHIADDRRDRVADPGDNHVVGLGGELPHQLKIDRPGALRTGNAVGVPPRLADDIAAEPVAVELDGEAAGAEEGGGEAAGRVGRGGGKATYFFRIAGRADYPSFKSLQDLEAAVDRAIARMNRCMLAVNFRREPVYLTDEQMGEPAYARYQYAVQKIPELRELRQLFIGRAIHSSPEQWQKDIKSLLAFNVSSADEKRWQAPKNRPAPSDQ